MVPFQGGKKPEFSGGRFSSKILFDPSKVPEGFELNDLRHGTGRLLKGNHGNLLIGCMHAILMNISSPRSKDVKKHIIT